MGFELRFAPKAVNRIESLGTQALSPRLHELRLALGRLEVDPTHPKLGSHSYTSIRGANGENVWESQIESDPQMDWRLFWHYGPEADSITVVSITEPL